MRGALPLPLLVLLLCGCGNCEGGRTPTRSPQPAALQLPAGPPEAPPEGEPVPVQTLQRYAPDAFAGAKATGPAKLQTLPMTNGGTLTLVRREYRKDDRRVQLEITDTLNAPRLRRLVTSQQGANRGTGQGTFRGAAIGGQPALRQWHGPSQTALVNLVVGDRFLINVRVSPAGNDVPATEAAATLPLAELITLAAATKPSEAGRPQAKPSPTPAP